MNFKEEMKSRISEIESIIMSYLPKEEGFQKTVCEAMNYSVMAGGKRLRPMLMQETYRLFGGTSDIVKPFMAAMEMIHTYSLVHDDLPAMDNDDYRRGRKTTHVLYGEAMGILAGDALLNYAFETIAKSFAMEPGNPALGQAFQVMASRAGIYGMLGGQVVDVESEGQPLSKEKLDFIHELKTGALIECAMLTGAVLAGASAKEQELISKIAKEVGLAFQIQDDILDVIGDQEKLGKPIGSDEKNQKTTYVTLRGLEQSKKDVEEISKQAMEELASLPYENEYLMKLMEFLIHRDY